MQLMPQPLLMRALASAHMCLDPNSRDPLGRGEHPSHPDQRLRVSLSSAHVCASASARVGLLVSANVRGPLAKRKCNSFDSADQTPLKIESSLQLIGVDQPISNKITKIPLLLGPSILH